MKELLTLWTEALPYNGAAIKWLYQDTLACGGQSK